MKTLDPVRAVFTATALLLFVSCGGLSVEPRAPAPPADDAAAVTTARVPAFLTDTIAAIQADYAPDRRVARFDVEAEWTEAGLVLTGTTDQPAAAERLTRALAAHGLDWDDEVVRLPDLAPGEAGWALVNISVANLRSEPRHPSELSTQAPLGTPLRVLERRGGWLLVQVPNGYLSWVDGGGVHRVDQAELEAHRRADKVIYLQPDGVARSAPSHAAPPVADLVAGGLLVRLGSEAGFHRVMFPDGREAYVAEAESALFEEWTRATRATEESLLAVAMSFLGRPYLWGGTSPKGMDCSGFTKTVYLLNGLVIPRDASQQIHAGMLVEHAGDFSTLRPGDLLFFGRPATATTPERVVHVGMWVGDNRFIHASGRIRLNSVRPEDPDYDAYNTGRYLRTKRILGDETGVHRLADDALYPRNGRFAPAATAGPAVR